MKSRTAILSLQVIAVSASLLTSIKILPGPDLIGIILAFYTLLFLPGLLLGRLLWRYSHDPLEVVCSVFTLGVAYASLLVCLGFVPGVSYRMIVCAGTGIVAALLFIDYVRGGRFERRAEHPVHRATDTGRERGGAIAMLLLIFVVCFVFFAGSGESGTGTDAPDHISFIRRGIDSGALFPRDSFYRDGDGVALDPRKGIWHPVLALWATQADAAVEVLWNQLPAVLSFFALAAFAFCARQLLGSFALVFPACVFLLLFYRGEGIGWFTKIAFSRNIAQVFLWCGLAFLLRYYRSGDRRYLPVVFFLSLVGVAVHLVFFLLLAAVMIGLLLFVHLSAEGRIWRRRYWLSAAVLVVAVAVPLALRALFTVSEFNMIHTHRQGMMTLGGGLSVVDPAEIVARVGLAYLFGVALAPFIFWIAPRSTTRALVGTLFLVPAAIVLLPFIAAPLAERFGYLYYRILYASPLMCLLAAGLTGLLRIAFVPRRGVDRAGPAGRSTAARVAIGRGIARRRVSGARGMSGLDRAVIVATGLVRRIAAVVVIAVFVLFPLRFGVHSLIGSTRCILAGSGGAGARYEALRDVLARDIRSHSVIVSDPMTSYVVSAYTDHFVTVTLDQHCSPADTAALARLEEVRDLFNPAVPLSAGIEWLRAVGAGYVLVDTRLRADSDFFGTVSPQALPLTVAKFRSCPAVLRPVAATEGFILFAFETPASGGDKWHACTDRFADPLPCRYTGGASGIAPGTNAGDDLVAEDLHLSRSVYAAGDTINGSLCWRMRRHAAFGLPLEWTVRLDTDFKRGPFFREWYSKLYRRRIERRDGILYRLTRTFRVRSGATHPDMWEGGQAVRQDFSVIVPREMAPGRYRVKIALGRAAYLTNRTIRDYFTNEDSLDGAVVADITIVMPHARTPAPTGGARRPAAPGADTSDD
ncbi:MAG TPA: hypothetical protein VMX58_09685 [Patescibacteria group bacterium]|nr:hypothetical protein [Patescibacteria group bacterium]